MGAFKPGPNLSVVTTKMPLPTSVLFSGVVLAALVSLWFHKMLSRYLQSSSSLSTCCSEGVTKRYPESFEICPQSRDLFGTLCPHRDIAPAHFDAAITQLQNVLFLKRSLILLTKKVETFQKREECIRASSTAQDRGLAATKAFLNNLMTKEVATWESVNNVLKFANDVFPKHVNDIHKYCSEEQFAARKAQGKST